MARAYSNAMLAYLNRDSIVGVYAKGSAYRRWDSVIDYVPGLSNVDIHLRVRGAGWGSPFQHVQQAMEIADRARTTFTLLNPEPLHHPRARVSDVAEKEVASDHLPPPADTVFTLHGEPYPVAEPSAYRAVVPDDGQALVRTSEFAERELPRLLVEHPGREVWDVAKRLTEQMSPAGPRALTQLGVDPYDAWSMNRTAIVRRLRALGREDLADAYAVFYQAGWRGFRSGFEDVEAGRDAVEAFVRLARLARHIVRY